MHRFAFVFLFFLIPFSASAEQLGFAKGDIWFSHEPFFSGEEVTIFSALRNSSEHLFSGTVIFFDGEFEIGRSDFELKERESEIISVEWTPSFGERSVRATILSDSVDQGILRSETDSELRFVDHDTDKDGVGNLEDKDDDNDGILDDEDPDPLKDSSSWANVDEIGDNVENLASQASPLVIETTKAIREVAETAFEEVEKVRISQLENVKEIKESLKEEEVLEHDNLTASALNSLKSISINALEFTLGSRILFYIILFFLIFLVISRASRLFRSY